MKALEKFDIAKRITVKSDNNVQCDKLQLTTESSDVNVVRMFRLMHCKAKESKLLFDPLGIFEKGIAVPEDRMANVEEGILQEDQITEDEGSISKKVEEEV